MFQPDRNNIRETSMMEGLFAGLDVSTQSCKIVVIDLEEECLVHIDTVHYDDDLPRFETHDGVIQGLEEGISSYLGRSP